MFSVYGVLIIGIIALTIIVLVWIIRPKRLRAEWISGVTKSRLDLDADDKSRN